MPIYGLTHNKADGTAILRRSVTTKIAIGLPPKDKNDHPQRLDHFIFQKKGQRGSGMSAEVVWEIDEEKTRHYGRNCRELEVILLDNNPDVVFRTEYAWWTLTQKQCWGDGESAMRRTLLHPRGEEWHPCANDGCSDLAEEKCRPSGDLYFILADYPTLGTICKLHTSSYQSIRELYAALEDIRSATGGRLMGLRVKLFVRPEKNAYKDREGNRKSGTKHVLGLELAVNNVRQLPSQTIDAKDAFEKVREQLAGRTVEIDDPEKEQATSVHAEFYPASEVRPVPQETLAAALAPESPTDVQRKEQEELQARIEDLFNDLRLTTAQRIALLDQHKDDRGGLLDRLERARQKRQPQAVGNEQSAAQSTQTRNGGNSSPSRPDSRRER
jgi:hypothetical protein